MLANWIRRRPSTCIWMTDTSVALPHVMERVLAHLRQVFSVFGLELKDGKLKVWAADPSQIPQSLQDRYDPDFRILKRSLHAPGDVERQGLPLAQAEGQTLDKEIARLRQLSRNLQLMVKSGLDLQAAVSRLRMYAEPASQYTLRSCQVTVDAAVAYDNALAGI